MQASCSGRPLQQQPAQQRVAWHQGRGASGLPERLHAYRARAVRRVLSQIRAAQRNAAHDYDYDVVALGNLCVDIVLPVEQLPAPDAAVRQRLLTRLTADPPSTESWEVGGSTNFVIAASRLGLKAATVGHLGPDVYGEFMRTVLEVRVCAWRPGAASARSFSPSRLH
jgi:hypothetical protein